MCFPITWRRQNRHFLSLLLTISSFAELYALSSPFFASSLIDDWLAITHCGKRRISCQLLNPDVWIWLCNQQVLTCRQMFSKHLAVEQNEWKMRGCLSLCFLLISIPGKRNLPFRRSNPPQMVSQFHRNIRNRP
ncbi:hypothetical protein V8C37DRAFT_380986 [Trichoderma ceciliae]